MLLTKPWLSLIAIFTVLFSSSCKAEKKDNDQSLLWAYYRQGAEKPLLPLRYHTHALPRRLPVDRCYEKSLAACNKVCFEMDMDDPAVLAGASAGFMDTSGKLLKDYFIPAQYERLERFVKDSLGVDLARFQMMKPIVLQSLFMSKTVDCLIPVSYEANIMEEAIKGKKEIIGLEAVQEQMDVLSSLPDDSVIAELVQMPDSFAESKRQYARMIAAYKAQNLSELYTQIQGSKDLGDELGVFLDDRNKKWIPRMSTRMQSKPVFFAVGAGHLWGPAGVISLLRKAGYTVVPVH